MKPGVILASASLDAKFHSEGVQRSETPRNSAQDNVLALYGRHSIQTFLSWFYVAPAGLSYYLLIFPSCLTNCATAK